MNEGGSLFIYLNRCSIKFPIIKIQETRVVVLVSTPTLPVL